jgi:hypothetical protein
MPAWRQLGDEDTETLRRIVTDLSWLIVDAGTFDPRAFILPVLRRTRQTGRPEQGLGYDFLAIPQ